MELFFRKEQKRKGQKRNTDHHTHGYDFKLGQVGQLPYGWMDKWQCRKAGENPHTVGSFLPVFRKSFTFDANKRNGIHLSGVWRIHNIQVLRYIYLDMEHSLALSPCPSRTRMISNYHYPWYVSSFSRKRNGDKTMLRI